MTLNLNFKLYGPFLWMGFNCVKATATSRRQFTFYHSVPRNTWYSFYRPRKDERLSRPWSQPVVLNTGLLDWESSALTTRPLLHNTTGHMFYFFRTLLNETHITNIRFTKSARTFICCPGPHFFFKYS